MLPARKPPSKLGDHENTAATLTTRRRDISAQIDMVRQNLATATADLRRRLANKERTAEIQRLIDETKAAEKKIAERIAELERLEFAAAAYTKADIEARRSGDKFAVRPRALANVRTDHRGRGRRNMRRHHRRRAVQLVEQRRQVLAGLDIIRTFCRYYGATAPVFIDNAESISQTVLRLIRRSFACKWSRVLRSNLKQRNDMAQIVSNEKGFKVIHVETLDMWAIGSPAKCDYCTADMATPDGGYYIAVLNKIYCPQCYKRWLSEACRHPQDAPIEDRNYNTYRQIFYFK